MVAGWRRRYPAPTRFFPERRTGREYLDDPNLPDADRLRSYRDLEFLGRLPWQFSPLWNACHELLEETGACAPGHSSVDCTVLELGAGTGHTARRLEKKALDAGCAVRVVPTDRAPLDARIRKLDWLRDPLPECDVIYANLVLHHFSQKDAILALMRMKDAARRGGVIFDLSRSRTAFTLFRWIFPLVVSSPVTVADGLVSVQQAFTPDELRDLAGEAGIRNPRVTTHGFFRARLSWRTS